MKFTFNHVGITVSDLERSIKFYRDILGLKVLRNTGEIGGEGSSFATICGLEGVRCKIATLLFQDTYFLQLFEFVYPEGKKALESRPCDVGALHISFVVEDPVKTYEELKAKGVRFVNPPVENSVGQFAAYFFDPDNIHLAITSEPRKVGG